jgi:APA family basic amino acid/polyamine antiporter
MGLNLFRTKSVSELSEAAERGEHRLPRVLGPKELIFLGIGAIIGAGIFSTLGTAAVGEPGVRDGAGPAVVLSFALLGFVCMLAGMCYAELTAMIPVSGSAYTYAFATLGEFVAWIIGWDLVLEYAIGNIGVAIAWSGYFDTLLRGFDIEFPRWLMLSYGDVYQQLGKALKDANTERVAELQAIIDGAPHLWGKAIIVNLPAVVITLAITWLLVRGVRESTKANNVMVWIKLAVLALFLGVGLFNLNPDNWTPFAPNGWSGIHHGAAIVFFAFIGFDAVSTAAEEAKNPQRTMPIGILGSLGICTVLYMIVGLVATGLVPYQELGSGADPLAIALKNFPAAQFIVALGAVISMAAVLLVFQYGQPRIFFAMSRDGLLPKVFAKLHPKYHTPHVTTIVTGLIVAIGAAVWDDDAAYDLTNIGTLSAFAIVSLGVLVLRVKHPEIHRPFKVPFLWVVAPLSIGACIYVMLGLPIHAWERFGIWLLIGLAIYFVRKLTMKPDPSPAR